jgi:YD repeat-containing protein
LLICNVSLFAQGNMTFEYFYDDLGQLIKVVDSTGTVIEYVYDPVGNILQIKRSSVPPGTLAIFNFTPQRGGPTQLVTIQGQAFDPTPANDIVQFNGTAALVVSASPATLAVNVPAAATTGPISMTVAGQTVTSTVNFTVSPAPVITSLSRKSALMGTSFPNAQFPALTVTGINLTGSTFALAPATSPPAATFGVPSVDPTGTSATMSLNVGTNIAGTFVLVATNSAGSSSAFPTKVNRFTIVDPRSTADTDGNGVPDVVKALFGVDVLDPTAFPPAIPSMIGQADSPAFTVLNRQSQQQTSLQAESPAFTVLNGSSSDPGTQRTLQAESPAFSVLNLSSTSSHPTLTAESPAFTVKNSSAGQAGKQTFTMESPLFSVLNGSASGAKSVSAESSLFSVLNNATAVLLPDSSRLLAAKNTLPSSRPKGLGLKRALHTRKTNKKQPNPDKAGNNKTVSSTVLGRGFRTPSYNSVPHKETKSTNQEEVTNANQNQ